MYELLKKLCIERGTNITELCKQVTGNSGNLATWKKGYMRSDYLKRAAEILEVSADCLLGRTDYATNTISNTGTNNGTQANIINNDCSIDTFNNPAVSRAYKDLTEREKLSVQMFILDTAAASEKSNAKIEVVERKE